MKITVKTKEKLLSYFNNSDDIWLRNNYDKEALKDEYSSEDFEYCWTRAMWDEFICGGTFEVLRTEKDENDNTVYVITQNKRWIYPEWCVDIKEKLDLILK